LVGVPVEPNAFAASIEPSGIREIFDLARGRDVCHLEVGQPDFPTPAHVVEAAFDAARRGSGYTQTSGIAEVREAAAARLARVHGLQIDPNHLLITQGGMQAVALLVAAMVAPGDEVLLPDPAWPNYEMAVRTHGGALVTYPLREENDYVPDPDEIGSRITDRTRILIINSPSNPTGAVFDDAVLERIVAVAARAGVLVLSDEVYDEMIFDGRPTSTVVRFDPSVVAGVWSCSKTYAMTGWRVGYVAAPEPLVDAMTSIQEGMISCVSSVAQEAALAAFIGPQDIVTEMCSAYEHRRDLVCKLLREAGIDPVVPGGAFYLMMPLADGADGRLAARHLVEYGVACAPGSAFGSAATSALRLSLASSEDTLTLGVERIVDWYARTDGGLRLS
jgi:aspartate aminotransferase